MSRTCFEVRIGKKNDRDDECCAVDIILYLRPTDIDSWYNVESQIHTSELLSLLQTSIIPRMFLNELNDFFEDHPHDDNNNNRKRPLFLLGPGGIPYTTTTATNTPKTIIGIQSSSAAGIGTGVMRGSKARKMPAAGDNKKRKERQRLVDQKKKEKQMELDKLMMMDPVHKVRIKKFNTMTTTTTTNTVSHDMGTTSAKNNNTNNNTTNNNVTYYAMGERMILMYQVEEPKLPSTAGVTLLYPLKIQQQQDQQQQQQLYFRELKKLSKRLVIWCFPNNNSNSDSTHE